MSSKSLTNKMNTESLWTWTADGKPKRKKGEKGFPITEFLQEKHRQLKETVSGPGAGLGVGCGAGLGLGLVGGVGYGGWPWSHLKLVFGVGVGCGIGIGFGYGQGLGYGTTFDSVCSRHKSKSERKIIHL